MAEETFETFETEDVPQPERKKPAKGQFNPTHLIGDIPVEQHHYSTGRAYYLDAEGRERRATNDKPLRQNEIDPEPGRAMTLDRDAFMLCMCAFHDEADGRAESGFTIATIYDQDHVMLTTCDQGANSRSFIVRIPEEFTVIGVEVPR